MIAANTTTVGETTVKLDALPDVADFRDRMFEATLVEVPPRIDLDRFKMFYVPVRHQGLEGSCTGFALSTVAHYLLRKRRMDPDENDVSPRMFYEMAKRYDEWEGEDYEGSSARGAMKGWHKHGVCCAELWTYEDGLADCDLNNERSTDALNRPLGAYYRVNHRDLVSMHTAIAEVGVLFATSETHEGWVEPDANGSTYATAESDIERIFDEEIPGRSYAWEQKRLLLYAHGGLSSERQQLENLLKFGIMLADEEVYLLAFHWHSGFLQTVESILMDAMQRRSPGDASADHTKAFMYDRVDAALEPLVRSLSGKLLWDELKTRGLTATRNAAADGRIFLKHLMRFIDANPEYEVHIVAHSAGSVFLAPLVQLLTSSPEEKLADGPHEGKARSWRDRQLLQPLGAGQHHGRFPHDLSACY